MITKNILDKKKSPLHINLHLKTNTILPVKITDPFLHIEDKQL